MMIRIRSLNRQKLSYVAAVCLLGFVAACTTVAVTGRQQLNLIPASQMNALSFSQYQQFLSENPVSNDSQSTAMVRRVGHRIQQAVELHLKEIGAAGTLDGYEWEFNLIEEDVVNAWAMPGGKVVVYTGLLPVAQTEAGLAVVMGHEIAHAIAQHGNERMSRGMVLEFGSLALSKALERNSQLTQSIFMTAFGVGAQFGSVLPHGRMQESEADELGLIFMAIAGYDPREAVPFWERMAAAGGGSPPEFLSTHPSASTRIADLQEQMPRALEYYNKSSLR